MSEKVYQIIQEQILKKLEEGTVPWRRTWNGFGKPKNIISNKEYQGFNWLMLSCAGYTSPFWMTKKQCQQLGGKIDYGKEKSTLIIFWKFLEKENDNGEVEKRFPMLRYYHVYNYEQTTGIILKPGQIFDPIENDPIENCENLVKNWSKMPEIVFGKKPSYSPSFDHIGMPRITDFHSSSEYYATLFHEMGHSTMHLTRLNREAQGLSYAKEELVAEMTACFLCGIVGIETQTIENSAAYIDSWRKAISLEPKIVIQAASMAQKAANYIQNILDFIPIQEEISDCA